MTHHNIPFSYQPKIEAVKEWLCTQTIRRRGKRLKVVGDTAILYGWSGQPYRSPWAWRREDIVLSEVLDMDVYPDGIYFLRHDPKTGARACSFRSWDTSEVQELARLDHISPPTGAELHNVLASMHSLDGGEQFQVIRWLPPDGGDRGPVPLARGEVTYEKGVRND